jgi:hypothetical protein
MKLAGLAGCTGRSKRSSQEPLLWYTDTIEERFTVGGGRVREDCVACLPGDTALEQREVRSTV